MEPDVRASLRLVTVSIAICSWIAISNHCAIAAVATTTEATESECPFHSKPAEQKQDSSNIQCCKVLRAVVAKISKDWARDDANFSEIDLSIAVAILFAESHNAAPLLLDTGPPGKTSFVELIGSVRAHAPPVFV
jgi:hypothetical protein